MRTDANQLTFDPIVHTPHVTLPQRDGSILIRPGRPILLNGEDEIGTEEAARIIGRSQRRVQALCDEGILREGADWRRVGERGNYIIKRAAALRLRGIALDSPSPPSGERAGVRGQP